MTSRPKRLSKATRIGYKETIDRLQSYFAPAVSVLKISVENAEEFISNLEPIDPHYISKGKELADSSVDRHLRQAKKIFTTAENWGYIKSNPFKGITLGKIRKREWYFIEVPQFNAIIVNTKTLRDQVLYGVMYWAGLRYVEAVNLRWEGRNLDFQKSEINIFNRPDTNTLPPFNVKDYEARSVPMNRWVVDMLRKLYAERDENCPYVFLTAKRLEIVKKRWHKFKKARKSGDWENRYMLNGTLRNFKARCIRAGIKTDLKLNLHGLRKSWAMNLANSGRVPMHTLQKLGGWSDIKTCEEFYLRSSDTNRERACEVLNELAGSGNDSEE